MSKRVGKMTMLKERFAKAEKPTETQTELHGAIYIVFFRTFLPLQVKEGPGPSAHCSLRGKSRFTHGQGGGWAQEPPASERLPGARAELAAGQQQQAPTGGVAQGKWQRAHAAPQRR